MVFLRVFVSGLLFLGRELLLILNVSLSSVYTVLKKLSAEDNETFGVNNDPQPRHISPEREVQRNSNARRERLRTKLGSDSK